MRRIQIILAVAFCLFFSSSVPVLALDAFDDFAVNPARSNKWSLSTGWSWLSGARTLSSTPGSVCSASWRKTLSFRDGLLEAKVKLISTASGAPASASLLFAWQTAPSLDRYRYLTLTAGARGTVTLGQKGIIGKTGERVLASKTMRILANRWYTVRIYIRPSKGVDVYLAVTGQQPAWVLSSGTLPLAAGKAGLMASYSTSQFDNFVFLDAAGKGCGKCHAGNPPAGYELAADTMQYWDGSWWDASGLEYPDDIWFQQGGHGDPDNYQAMGCIGVNGCHDLAQSVATHLDGKVHRFADRSAPDSALPTVNTYHLRREFIQTSPVNAWDFQVTIDDGCRNTCHDRYSIMSCADHERDHLPAPLARLMNGDHLTYGPDEQLSIPYPMDKDLSSNAGKDLNDIIEPAFFVACVSCHNPHGTGVTDQDGHSNRMLRGHWYSASDLCMTCHR